MLKICNVKQIQNRIFNLPNINLKKFTIVTTMEDSVEESIRNKLTKNFYPSHIEIINESFMHNVPKGSETHFKVVIISEKFKDLPLIKRHRLVNDILKEELQTGVHALSIMAKTPDQWEATDKIIERSPNCKGGFGK